MKIVSWNVNGIRAVEKKGAFTLFLKTLKPDVICLQETKAEQQQSPLDLPDYKEFWSSAKKKGYSGTAIFIKQAPKSILLGFPKELVKKYKLEEDRYGNPNEEGRIIAIDTGTIYIVSVYTPNSKGDLSRLTLREKHWDPAFLAYMKQLERKRPVVFCGDLNVAHSPIDLARPKQNEGKHGYTKEEREGINEILSAGFIDTFRTLHPNEKEKYTWWTHWQRARERNVGWRIDYIFTSKKLVKRLKKAEIHPEIMGSDHCPVSITL
ncbi:MAG: exodeoxyribonuclease III [Candidatus Paceibacterota bacterium]